MSTGQVSDKTCIWGLTVISSRDDWGWELSSSSPSAMLRGAGAPWKQALLWVKVKVFITQSCPTLCDPMDCSSPGSSVHGILQARILEWVAIFFSRGSSRLRDWTWVSHIAGRLFTDWATREDVTVGALVCIYIYIYIILGYSWLTMLC